MHRCALMFARRLLLATLSLALLLLTVSLASGDATINVGHWILDPNTAGQEIELYVTGGDAVDGVDFFLQVADGGPEAPGGSIDGPAITDVDILGPPDRPGNEPTIFSGNNTGEAAGGSLLPQFWQSGTSTDSGTVTADDRLATVTIDTSGFTSGSWELKMTGTLMGDSTFRSPPPGVTTSITNGSISIATNGIPEPSTLLLLVLGTFSLLSRRDRRRRRRR